MAFSLTNLPHKKNKKTLLGKRDRNHRDQLYQNGYWVGKYRSYNKKLILLVKLVSPDRCDTAFYLTNIDPKKKKKVQFFFAILPLGLKKSLFPSF